MTTHELRSHGRLGGSPPISQGEAAASFRAKRTGIAVFGLFGCGNLGNDGSLESMLSFLRDKRPGARLLCICKVPEVVTETFGIETVPIRRKGGGHRTRLDRLLLKIPGKRPASTMLSPP